MGPILSRRLTGLCDPGSLRETFDHPGSVYFTGTGTVGGRPVMIVASDPDPPSLPADLMASSSRAVRALQEARSAACPVVFLYDAPALYHAGKTAFQGTGVELMMGEDGVGRQYYEIGRLSGRVPLVCGVFGNMAQAQAFPVAMCNLVVMVRGTSLAVARPDAVKAMLGEEVSYQTLGGAEMHHSVTGICHKPADTEEEALRWIRRVLTYLPSHYQELPAVGSSLPLGADAPALASIIPERIKQAFDVRRAIHAVVDEDQFLEIGSAHAAEAVTGFGQVQGRKVGIVANNSMVRGGVLFPETCRKIGRFVALCDAFNLPLVFLADAPGFMIGAKAERAGVVQAGAILFSILSQCRVPRICIVLRRAYTAGLYAMSGSGFNPWGVYALKGASLSVYGPEAMERFLADLDLPPVKKEEIRRQMVEESNVEVLLRKGFLKGILAPEEVRETIARFLQEAGALPPRSLPRSLPGC